MTNVVEMEKRWASSRRPGESVRAAVMVAPASPASAPESANALAVVAAGLTPIISAARGSSA